MLTLIMNMRPPSAQMQLIAQELAIDMAHFSFVPVVTHHIPGIANKVADELSRWPQPGVTKQVPDFLKNAVRVFPPSRTDTYYMTKQFLKVPFQAG